MAADSPPPDVPPARPNPPALRRYREALGRLRQATLDAARALAELDACGHWRAECYASLAEMGEDHGSTAAETRMLLQLAQSLEVRPEWTGEVRAGRLSPASAALLRDVVCDTRLQRPGEDLLRLAQETSHAKLRRLVRRRVAQVREGGPVTEVTVHLRGPDLEALERARAVASRRADRPLGLSETVAATVRHYLACHDAASRSAGRRRMPPTRGRPGRGVPAEVARALARLYEGRCAVPGCDHGIWVERAHLRAKRIGGDQELENLILLCRRHHRMLDAGLIRLVGPPGGRRFITSSGRDLGPLREPGSDPPPDAAPSGAPGG